METRRKQGGVKFPPPPGVLGVRKGAMAAPGRCVLHQRRELLLEKKKVGSARLLDWSEPGNIMVDQVKMATGEGVSTELFKVLLPAASLKKLVVAPGGTTVKAKGPVRIVS